MPGEIQRIVPDGSPEIILNLANPFESQGGGNWHAQPEQFFVGQITGPMLVRPRGPAKVLGIRFHPHGASCLLRLPIHELNNQAILLDDLAPGLANEFERVKELKSTAQQLAHVDRALQAFFQRGGAEDNLVALAISQLKNSAATDLADIAFDLGLSSRQFQRRFKSAVGIGPKLFSRMQRFQRVFQTLAYSPGDWVNVAVECGYYDQAHLINDFRDFAGEPPNALLRPETDLAFHFLQTS